MRKLQIAFSKKEKGARLLANLEQLKEGGEVPEERFQSLCEEYSALRDEGEQEIAQITERLRNQLEAVSRRSSSVSHELEDLQVRIRVGELAEKKHAGRVKKLVRSAERLEKQAQELETLVDAASSEDLGGFLDIPLKRTKAGRRGN